MRVCGALKGVVGVVVRSGNWLVAAGAQTAAPVWLESDLKNRLRRWRRSSCA